MKGRVFQRSSLEYVSKQLKQGYNARGKYNARITTKVKPLTENNISILNFKSQKDEYLELKP